MRLDGEGRLSTSVAPTPRKAGTQTGMMNASLRALTSLSLLLCWARCKDSGELAAKSGVLTGLFSAGIQVLAEAQYF